MHNEVKKRVENGDIRGLQYVFINCLDVDPTFEKYKEDFEYCCKNVPEIFEKHADLATHIDNNQRNWTEDYWNGIKVDLLKNFSKERFEHMRNVAKIVYADKISRLIQERELEAVRREFEQENKRVEEGIRKNHINRNTKEQELIKEQKRKQEQELEAARRKLEQENKCIEEEMRKNHNAQKVSQSYNNTKNVYGVGGEERKKALGAVLVIVVFLIIVIILISVVQN